MVNRKPSSDKAYQNRCVSQRHRRLREKAQRSSQQALSRNSLPGRNKVVASKHPLLKGKVTYRCGRLPYDDHIPYQHIGAMDDVCEYCGALHWSRERTHSSSGGMGFGLCCDHGRVQLPTLDDPPPLLRHLLLGTDSVSTQFRQNIVQYNSALSFTSIGAKRDDSVNTGRGPRVFRIQGELRHQYGSLCPVAGQQPIYSQLYIYDPVLANVARMNRNGNLDPTLLLLLEQMLRENHHYSSVYRHAHQILKDSEAPEDFAVVLRALPGTDQRRYNLPTCSEIAAVIPSASEHATEGRDIVLRMREGRLHRIYDTHPAYSPLHYVLLFPYGEHGWSQELTLNPTSPNGPRRRLTQTRHAAYRLHERVGEFPTILLSGSLCQHYMVDMWATADQNRLRWFQFNQSHLRADLYSGVQDLARQQDVNVDLSQIGKRYVLPSSYKGGPRDLFQSQQNAMALARYHGHIDLFITMTANPNWEEVVDALLPGQLPADRPDILSRVFHLKAFQLIHDVFKDEMFGHAFAQVHSTEFQKRGLPHVHLLLFLGAQDRLRTGEDIDSVIRAEWPDSDLEPELFEIVKRRMVHGPCGSLNPHAPCMDKGVCTKGFPKPYNENTTINEDGYPAYRRRQDGRAYNVGGYLVDNRWIVPYNPTLSKRYNCHINVESAASFSTVKYIMKYIHKGPDRTSATVQNVDEITEYLDGRYISAHEAMWRIFHFDLHGQSPNVVCLDVHEPGQHLVVYNENDDVNAVLQRAQNDQSTLTAYFAANADQGPLGELARQYRYQEFPQHFVYENHHWKMRQQGFALGRMYFIPPTAGEKFYIRLLLTVTQGAQSFEDLRTFENQKFGSFREACIARGLLEDDAEYKECLRDAGSMQSGHQLRQLFITILLFSTPTKPEDLWNEFRPQICDDLRYRLQLIGYPNLTEELIWDYGLFLIERLLAQQGRSLKDFPQMPQAMHRWSDQARNSLIAQASDYDCALELAVAEERAQSFNIEQAVAYDTISSSLFSQNPKIYFLHGGGGTGKTYLYNTLANRARGQGLLTLCVASSGIAALLLSGGRTSHSTFKIPIENLAGDSICAIAKQTQLAELLRKVALILWDEVSMQHRWCIEAVDRTMRDLRDDNRPFGGVVVVFGGDFHQILPVVPNGGKEEILYATLKWSALWRDIVPIKLQRNERLQTLTAEDHTYNNWIRTIADGSSCDEEGKVQILQHLKVDTIEQLIDFTYPDLSHASSQPHYFLERVLLTARNEDVQEINERMLQRLQGKVYTLQSADSILSESGADSLEDQVPTEVLRSLNPPNLPISELRLKIGCPIILLRNLNPSQGLCNGTRLIITDISRKVIRARIIGEGKHDGEEAFIPRISMRMAKSNGCPFPLCRRQFPIRLAFAITINKAQGQSLKYVGLDLRAPVFSHGQLYVALSRVTSSSRIRILPADSDGKVSNVVYSEMLD